MLVLKKQFKNYLVIAKGSTNEITTLLEIIQLVYKLRQMNYKMNMIF